MHGRQPKRRVSAMAAVNRMKAPASLGSSGGLEDFEEDVEALIRENQLQRRSVAAAAERERELNIYRSDSAPPTVEGARNAIDSLFGGRPGVGGLNGYDFGAGLSVEEMTLHPEYLSYYYSTEHLNPRLPPPALSKEDWRVAQRFQVGASTFARIDDRRKEVAGVGIGDGGSSLLFSLQPGLPMRDVDGELAERRTGSQRNSLRQAPAEWAEQGRDSLVEVLGVGSVRRRKSFADALQEELGQSISVSSHMSRLASRNDFVNVEGPAGVTDIPRAQFQDSLKTVDYLKSKASSASLIRVQSFGSSASRSFASAMGSSLVRSATPDPQPSGRSSSPCLPTLGGREDFPSNGSSTCMAAHKDITTAFSGLNLSNSGLSNDDNNIRGASPQDFAKKADNLFSASNGHNNRLQQDVIKTEIDASNISSFPVSSKNIGIPERNMSKLTFGTQIDLSKHVTLGNGYPKIPSGSMMSNGFGNPENPRITGIDFSGSQASNSPLSQGLPTSVNHQIDAGGMIGQYLNITGIQAPLIEPLLAQHLQRNHSLPHGAFGLGGNLVTSSMDMSAYQKAYFKALLAQQKLQYELPFLGNSGAFFNNEYYTTLASSLGLQYPINSVSSSILPSLGSISPLRQEDNLSQRPMMKSSARVSVGSWNSEYGVMEEDFALSLLDELKSNKSRSFELLDIVGHVVEFSADQYGSRFIQQKLETASIEEKNKIFPEIFPHSRALITDVFGNYVIQKACSSPFLEHGSEIQKKQLSGQLIGHVLPLSLQMYGCRVIQKALEVVDVEQQTKIVLELDGSIMKCVRDQNGNHVIQKCIECVPQERIQFIISAFYGQVVPLSTHPYGCRVIQRVLEHCDDAKTQGIMMEEILQAICSLAQDQYGNYVVQHILQHGKQHERSAIICKLAGQIVKMSQQKFASNVIEKCLTYGSPEERQLLINEMLGSTDENEPLQAMMKDQFGNYVVQKALETCDDKNRELILSRIKAHVNSLKRYTYGKHIAARVEKVIVAGERRIGMSSFTP
ncbi:hypothetical protein Taro_045024 [Colocasia esculenta]|uniref:PUM-HD domain-containing protein n=1 Tax=Colocasia esculenta TaxID=4460 RepID=A0A843X1Y5_COLES|nr:hypothetical protein [Colocasia esculenta]